MKRLKIAVALVLLAAVGVIGWQVAQPREPVYKGKRLSEWLEAYRSLSRRGPFEEWEVQMLKADVANEAVRQIGTNSIPTLLRLLRAVDSPLKVKLMNLAQRQHVIKIECTSAERWNNKASRGFSALGTNAQSAVPALIEIVDQNISRDSLYWTIWVLGGVGPTAKEAVPSLLRCVTNSDWAVRHVAIKALGQIHAEPNRVVPVLIEALHDPSRPVQDYTVGALARFGPDARLAMPALVELYRSDQTIAFALKAIDPEAAAKAGITNSP